MTSLSRTTEPESAPGSAQGTWRLFGLTVASDFPFANQLPPGTGDPDLVFSCVNEPPLAIDWEQAIPVYTSPHRTKNG
jgi:hypothetical protein